MLHTLKEEKDPVLRDCGEIEFWSRVRYSPDIPLYLVTVRFEDRAGLNEQPYIISNPMEVLGMVAGIGNALAAKYLMSGDASVFKVIHGESLLRAVDIDTLKKDILWLQETVQETFGNQMPQVDRDAHAIQATVILSHVTRVDQSIVEAAADLDGMLNQALKDSSDKHTTEGA